MVTAKKTVTAKTVRRAAPAAPQKSVRVTATKAAPKATATVAKPVAPPKAQVVNKPKVDKPPKAKKPKLVRDSFTIPKDEYAMLETLKQRAGQLSSPAKKSELLRAGIKALAAMPDTAFMAALKVVPSIKTGRPAKD